MKSGDEGGRWQKLILAVGSLLLGAVVCFGAVFLLQPPDPNVLLAKAYSERRTIELRISGAAYGPMRVERGGASSWQSRSAALREAEKILKRDEKQHIDDPSWLQAQARASLLEWDYDGAIRQMDDALMLKPGDPIFLVDRATAYFERAEKLGLQGAIDYGEAAEDLSKAIKKNPKDTVALFNRAVVFQKLYLPNEAIADLEQYLQIDLQSAWAAEAKKKLQSLRKLVKDHMDASAQPPIDAISFARLASEPDHVYQLDQRIEDYQDHAIREWLPLAYPVKSSTAPEPIVRRNARSALNALARLLLERHHDKWLLDLLQSANDSHDFALAIESLSDTVAYSATGEASSSLRSAIVAKDFFLRVGNKAGRLRAEVEEVHALQRLHQTNQCRKKTLITQTALPRTGYGWISSELNIDQGACSLTVASFVEGQSAVSAALKQTLANEYPTLYLRALGIAAAGNNFEGDMAASWGNDEEGLAGFWQQSNSLPVRGHQFYDDLVYSAELLEEPTVALAYAHESASMAASSGNRGAEFLARQHSARIAMDAGDWRDGQIELTKAVELGKSLEGQAVASHLFSEITNAEIDIKQANISGAEKRLADVESELALVGNTSLNLDFHKVKAEIFSFQQKHTEAEAELLLALDIVDKSEKHLTNIVDRQSWIQQNSGLYKALVSAEIAKTDPDSALDAWERYLAAGLDFKEFSGGPNPSEFHNQIRQWRADLIDKTVISYALLPEGLALFLADSKGVKFHLIGLSSKDLEKLSSGFLELCADPHSDIATLRSKARRLFNIFIAPFASDLSRTQTLIIEPDPLIGDLPFQALLFPDGRYLGEVYTVVSSPGMMYQLCLRRPAHLSPTTKALVIGSTANLVAGAVLRPDENAMAEAREVAGRFTDVTLLQGEAATQEQIEFNLPKSEAIHFVGHALSGATEEGLLLADSHTSAHSNLWTSRQLNPKAFKRCQLVVLSACSTGRTYRSHREMHGGMVRGILAAGVPNVVASRWDVDSVETRRFIQHFYDALLSGKGVSAALHEAELQQMHDPGTSHPYYWAAFAAFGRA
jgi:CHAT domain-containing protein